MASKDVPARPAFLRPRSLALVVGGGAVGTMARHLLEEAFAPPPGELAWVTLVINVTGAFLLGALLTALTRTGADSGVRRSVRIGAGTGVLGGFTTYSTFAVEVHGLLGAGQTWVGVGYATGSVAAGVVAAALGLLLARRLMPQAREQAP